MHCLDNLQNTISYSCVICIPNIAVWFQVSSKLICATSQALAKMVVCTHNNAKKLASDISVFFLFCTEAQTKIFRFLSLHTDYSAV